MYRCWVEVSKAQIAKNFQAVRNVVGPNVDVMPVVKADAYRHGAREVAKLLAANGAQWMAVSSVSEGAVLRDAGITARILVMADFLPTERQALLDHQLTPVLHSLEDIAVLDDLAKQRGEVCAYHLKIDSGMGRLGTRAAATAVIAAISSAKHAKLEGLMTHFASAADYISVQTDEQIAQFQTVCAALAAAGIKPRYTHLSSTIAVAYNRKEAWGNIVRPGHAIYGYVSPARGESPQRVLDVKPALSWKTRVLAVKHMPKGTQIGYGGIFRAPRPMTIAVLAAGYADGLPHGLGNKGKVIIHGRFSNILGAVSMDVTTIDVTDLPLVQTGDVVTLLGHEGDVSIDAQQMAKIAGGISYSVLCGISARVERVYIEE